jgi:hypothetical protein
MKQTAVEFLEIKLKKVMIDNQIQQTLHLFEQAKEIEQKQKQKIRQKSYMEGYDEGLNDALNK